MPILANKLGVLEQVYKRKDPPSIFEVDILDPSSPGWAMMDLSLEKAKTCAIFLKYSSFHASLSIMKQCVTIAKAAYSGEQQVKQFALALYRGPLTQAPKILTIAQYPEEIQVLLEYVVFNLYMYSLC